MLSESDAEDYQRLKTGLGYTKLSRTTIRMTGKDRLTFLQNFCTADVKQLAPGKATEAFILNGKGKTLGHVHVLAGDNEAMLNTSPDQFAVLFEHLDRYIMREDIQLIDESETIQTLFLGPGAIDRLAEISGKQLADNEIDWFLQDEAQCWAGNVELAGSGFLVLVPLSVLEPFEANLSKDGFGLCSENALHSYRVENVTPWFGVDCSQNNLPQELQRDDKTISFNKGCYLGQETVARIDALGHVNQLLVGFGLSTEAAVDTELILDEKVVGKLTSVAWSPSKEEWTGMGYVKRKHRASGTELSFENGVAKVS